MKKYSLVLLVILIVTGCTPQAVQVDKNMLYTEAAKTVFVQMTAASVLTPSVTPTFTPVPTSTITLTPVPSPTPIPPTPTLVSVPAGKVVAPIFLYTRVAGSRDDDPQLQVEQQRQYSPGCLSNPDANPERKWVQIHDSQPAG